ncbi:MAG: hypothetical protein K2W96_22860 [Gemmataceae bacterium]|nr:hypothetical protein [Gemmataceae bacterium]
MVRDYYDYGRRQGSGVMLEMISLLGVRPLCSVYVPEGEAAASTTMMKPLKLTMPCELVEAKPVRSAWWWGWRRWLNQRRRVVTWTDTIPSRADVRRLIEPSGGTGNSCR